MPHWVKSLLGNLVAIVSGSAAVATALLGKPGDFGVDARLLLIFLCFLSGMIAVVIWSIQVRAFWRGALALTIVYLLAALAAFVVPRYHGLQVIRSAEFSDAVGQIILLPPRSSAPTVSLELSARDAVFEPTGFRLLSEEQKPNEIEFSKVTSTTATITIEKFRRPMGLTVGFKMKAGKARSVVADVKVVDGDVPVLRQDYQSSWRNPFLAGSIFWLISVAVLFFWQ